MDDEFNYIPHGMMLAVPKKTDVLKMGEGIDILNSTLDDIKSKVNMYYNRLKVTQGDQNNNFKNDVQEGSTPYREMCYCLARLSYYLGQRNSMEFSMSELRRRIDEFRNASEVYYKRGKTSNRERLIVAGDASKEMDNYLRVYDETFAAVDKGYPVNTLGTEIKDSSLSSIKQQIGSYFESYEQIGEMPRLTPEEITQKKAEMIERNNSLRLYEEKLNSVMGKKPDTTKKMSTDDVAKHVVYTNLINNVKRDGVTAEEIDGRTEMLSKTFFSDEVSALTSNKVFKEVAKKYQADTPKKWKEILQKSFDFGNEFSDFVNKRRGQEGINYIMTDKIVLSAKKNVKYVDKYDRLGEVVAKQILGAPRNPVLLQGLAAGQFEYKDLQKVCTEYLRKQDVLAAGTRNYLDNDALKTKLDNGTLKAEVLTKVAEPLKKVAEQRTRQEEIEKKNAEIAAKTKANIPSRK